MLEYVGERWDLKLLYYIKKSNNAKHYKVVTNYGAQTTMAGIGAHSRGPAVLMDNKI